MATERYEAREGKPILLRRGEICPHCRLAKLEATPDDEVVCPLCGLRTGSPCT